GKKRDEPPLLTPKLLLTYRLMTSLLAVRIGDRPVFFVGTADGQVLKLTVDGDLRPRCLRVIWKADDDRRVFPKMLLDPVGRKHLLVVVRDQLTVDGDLRPRCLRVIWKADDDRRVFPKMLLDPVGRKHLLVVVRDQLMRVPVALCGRHDSLESCWEAQDPFCGWCSSTGRCSFQDECPASLWLSVPEDASRPTMLSHRVQRGGDGELRLVVSAHLTTGGTGPPADFSCRFVSGGAELTGLQHRYPQCTCLLPAAVDGLRVALTVRLGGVNLTAELDISNCSGIAGPPASLLCSRCLAAGCEWSRGVCTWTTADWTANTTMN
ncbi:hypothetical protein CRUP_019008, partial [Coryphaenoides rupestris]